nr:hypothetical protein [Mucilaginibacter sp. E4BP6]
MLISIIDYNVNGDFLFRDFEFTSTEKIIEIKFKFYF